MTTLNASVPFYTSPPPTTAQPYYTQPVSVGGGYGYDTMEPKRPGLTFQAPRSWWFYICVFCLCSGIAVAMGLVITVGVLGIIHWTSSSDVQQLVPYNDYYDADAAVKAPAVVANAGTTTTTSGSGSSTTASSDLLTIISDLEARVAGAEERLRTLTLEPGPKGDQGARGMPGTCSADQCTTASSSLGTSSVLRITGDKANQMPPTIAQNAVSLRVSDGDVEVLNGGLATKGPITTQSMFASPSDARVKFNVTSRNDETSLRSILKLRPVEYSYTEEWVEHTKREHAQEIGLIAQEVKKVYPFSVVQEAIYVPGQGIVKDFNMLNYHSIISDLVGSIVYLENELAKTKLACAA